MDFLFKVDFLSFRFKRVEDIFAEQNTYFVDLHNIVYQMF